MAGENRQDFNRPSKERMTEQKQGAERELNIGSDKTQQQEQQGQCPQRNAGDRAQDSQQASGDVRGPGGAPFQPRGRYRKSDH